MRSLAEYRAILKKKGFRYSFQEAWRKIQRFHYLSDPDILNSQWAYKVHKSLSKRYLHFWHDYDRVCDLYDKYPDKIWTCWLQGEEQAPPIVKKCLASIRRHSGGREVIVITEKNMWQYVSFPDFILRKKKGRHHQQHPLFRPPAHLPAGTKWRHLDGCHHLYDR